MTLLILSLSLPRLADNSPLLSSLLRSDLDESLSLYLKPFMLCAALSDSDSRSLLVVGTITVAAAVGGEVEVSTGAEVGVAIGGLLGLERARNINRR